MRFCTEDGGNVLVGEMNIQAFKLGIVRKAKVARNNLRKVQESDIWKGRVEKGLNKLRRRILNLMWWRRSCQWRNSKASVREARGKGVAGVKPRDHQGLGESFSRMERENTLALGNSVE